MKENRIYTSLAVKHAKESLQAALRIIEDAERCEQEGEATVGERHQFYRNAATQAQQSAIELRSLEGYLLALSHNT